MGRSNPGEGLARGCVTTASKVRMSVTIPHHATSRRRFPKTDLPWRLRTIRTVRISRTETRTCCQRDCDVGGVCMAPDWLVMPSGGAACRAEEVYHVVRWKRLADQIEAYAALLIPSSYFLVMIFLLNSTFTDKYNEDSHQPLYEGLPDGTVKSNMHGAAAISYGVFTLALLLIKILYDRHKAGQTQMGRVMAAVRREASRLFPFHRICQSTAHPSHPPHPVRRSCARRGKRRER